MFLWSYDVAKKVTTLLLKYGKYMGAFLSFHT
jgi:hypothetical protein